ncbi:MAG: TIGR02679 domain-containing protein [Erysipelotrichaceae bacterium]|nr:TIGR02679 domain-containing protein [Erysipelotrichaceae bacterium]
MHEYSKYFKNNPGFDRFIQKLYEKYQSLSKFSGTIKLSNLKEEDAISLSRLFGTTYQEKENITISIKKFIRIMESSKYEDFDIYTLVEEYLGINLVTKKEKEASKRNKEEEFYQSIIEIEISKGSLWLKNVIENKIAPYSLIQKRYNQNKESLRKELLNVIAMINHLPKEKVMLPIFSSTITKDPHYLDLENRTSTLFLYALSSLDNSPYPNTREEKITLLSKYNIEIDNLSNFVLTYNLLSEKDYINAFSKNKESLILNIQNIINTKKIDTKQKKVYIFENPSILTEILSKNIDVSVIISGGFPNSSVYLLLDKLLENKNKLYYNGDFDPEGLIIASKLKEKYQSNLELFCYSISDYETCISKKKISPSRLNKLSKIETQELLEIKELLLKNKVAAYQENNKKRIINFLKENI